MPYPDNSTTCLVSIICPVYNEEEYIDACIESIIKQDYPLEKLEVFFIDGMSTDNTREIVKESGRKYPFIKMLDNPDKAVSPALNIGIKASRGEVIIRMDAHCIYPDNYISVLVARLFELGADNVGALCRTLPAKDNSQSRAVSIVSSHRFGVGNSLFRVGADKIMEVDTVPFGCFKADIFERIGFFDVDLTRNQDDEFNARIIKNGGKIFLIPELEVDYFARDTIAKMSKMFYQYGLFKPLVNKKLGQAATIRQFFPPAFLVGLILGGILCILFKHVIIVYLSVIAIYTLLCLYFACKSAKRHNDPKLILLVPIAFFVIHISYGRGYLWGILRFQLSGKTNAAVEINR